MKNHHKIMLIFLNCNGWMGQSCSIKCTPFFVWTENTVLQWALNMYSSVAEAETWHLMAIHCRLNCKLLYTRYETIMSIWRVSVGATHLSMAMICQYSIQFQYTRYPRVAGDDVTLVGAEMHHLKHLDRQGYEVSSLQQGLRLPWHTACWFGTWNHGEEWHIRAEFNNFCIVHPAT